MTNESVKQVIDQLVDDLDKATKRKAPAAGSHLSLVGEPSAYLKAVKSRGEKLGIPVRWAKPYENGCDGFYLFDTDKDVSWRISEFYDIDAVKHRGMSCTAEAVFRILEGLNVVQSHICVIGRGHSVKGLAEKLLENDATITICHSKTKNLTSAAFFSEIVVNASPVATSTFSAAVDSLIVDISGGLSRWKDSNLATYIGPEDIGRVNVSLLLNRFVKRGR